MQKPDISKAAVRRSLPHRTNPYWHIIEYGRHIGFRKEEGRETWWVARTRLSNGMYRRKRLAKVEGFHRDGRSFSEALAAAQAWFATDEISCIASEAYPIGTNQHLIYEKTASGFTVGDAMHDYVEWKRIAATQSHFDTILSLINHHIIPRVGDIRVEDFTSRQLTDFCKDVLETVARRGRRRYEPKRISLNELKGEALRKRKKTVNTLIGILRIAFLMAWENGEIESDRAWRCIRRLPNFDQPRTQFLTREQCRLLLANCSPDLARLVLGALYSGCRVTELTRLRVRDVGAHVFGLYIAPFKSQRARYIHLPEEGMSFFLDQCESKSDEDLVFRMDSGKQWRGGHKHLFKKAVRCAGLPDGFVFHGLRHTYASQLVQAGMPIVFVARQLGHANTETVSRTYGHLSCQSIEQQLALKFAPLEDRQADPRLDAFRDTLQGKVQETSSWPRKNCSRSEDELLEYFKQN